MAEMLVVGDSILWGQGLTEDEKCTSLVRDAWSKKAGDVGVHRFAHSGADLWDDGQSGVIAALDPSPPSFSKQFSLGEGAILRARASAATPDARDAVGEVPDEETYLLRQILDARAELNRDVDLVLVDAGINDTEVYNLVLPGKHTSAVVARGASIRSRIDFALRLVARAFPTAKIILTGYYPIVSERTCVVDLLQFTKRVAVAALEDGVHLADDFARALVGSMEDIAGLEAKTLIAEFHVAHPMSPLVRNIATRCDAWTIGIHAVLADVVRELAKDGVRAAFADPGFGPDDALFAPGSALWAFSEGNPLDPMAAARKQYCEANGVRGFDALVIECASLGHPNVAGSKRYADAIIAAANRLELF